MGGPQGWSIGSPPPWVGAKPCFHVLRPALALPGPRHGVRPQSKTHAWAQTLPPPATLSHRPPHREGPWRGPSHSDVSIPETTEASPPKRQDVLDSLPPTPKGSWVWQEVRAVLPPAALPSAHKPPVAREGGLLGLRELEPATLLSRSGWRLRAESLTSVRSANTHNTLALRDPIFLEE